MQSDSPLGESTQLENVFSQRFHLRARSLLMVPANLPLKKPLGWLVRQFREL